MSRQTWVKRRNASDFDSLDFEWVAVSRPPMKRLYPRKFKNRDGAWKLWAVWVNTDFERPLRTGSG